MPVKFDCIAQRIADAMDAVKKIAPVVTLIRTVDDQETDLESLREAIASYENDIQIMEGTISEVSEEDHKDDVKELLERYSATLSEKKSELEGLIRSKNSIEDEIEEYLKYANSFYYVGTEEILLDLLGKAVREDTSEEEFFAILFILKGEAVQDAEVVKRIAHEYAKKTTDDVRKNVLRFVENYSHEAICELIREN